MIELINDSCENYISKCKDGAFDLVIADPPYGINKSGGRLGGDILAENKNYKKYAGGDKKPMSKDFFSELKRISKNQIIFGANHFVENIPFANSPAWIVWDKKNGENYFADCELIYTSFSTAVRIFRFRWQGMLQEHPTEKETRIHPNQKPKKIYDWILRKYATPGSRILDPFLGSGSSAIAAHYFDCEFTGIEKDPEYFELAKKRIERETRQLKLF